MAAHHFNTIRLRVFVNPEAKEGYAPEKGYCDLKHTLAMARRIKKAGMNLLSTYTIAIHGPIQTSSSSLPLGKEQLVRS